MFSTELRNARIWGYHGNNDVSIDIILPLDIIHYVSS